MKRELLEGLNKVSETLVLFDSLDLSFLGQAYSDLTAAAETAASSGATDIAGALTEMAALTEKIIMEEVESQEDALVVIGERIASIMEAIREERSLTPEELGLAKPEGVSTESTAPSGEGAGNPYLPELTAAIAKEPDIAQDFVLETKDHLDNCTPALLELEKNPEDKDNINLVFRCFHTIKGVAGFLNLVTIQEIAHHAENILDKVRSDLKVYDKGTSDLMFESSDALRAMVNDLCRLLEGKQPEKMPVNLIRLQARLDAAMDDTQAPPIKIPVTALKTDSEPTSPAEIKTSPGTIAPAPALPSSEAAAKLPRREAGSGRKEIIKVDADRLNRLIDTIGELVIAETIVLQSDETRSHPNPSYLRKISQLDKITRELQTMGMSLRMVAVKPTFQNMARLVRDLGDKQNKKIDFVMHGEDTEIDKNIVDKIGDPLVHMIRNAVDHGIENAEERAKAGKPPAAQVEIRAFHRAGNICIEIEDDGRGINPDVIFQKAVEKGLVAPDANLSKSEIINLIFAPGFSTAQKITDVSGRGVGMDVVKRNIAELNGSVEISSEPGLGSVFSIRLPLTLAIIDGLVTRVGEERFIIPTLAVTRAVHINENQIHHIEGRGEFILHQGRNFPIYRLNRFLDLASGKAADGSMLMLLFDDGERSAGIIIDELIGKQQIVIKSLGNAFRKLEGYSGCAILSDGTVGLIIDINSVIKNYHNPATQ